jgi:Ca2+-binding RTX toxin-like protein
MAIVGTAGNDDLTGTSGTEKFKLFQGGDDTAEGRGGDDTFQMGAAFGAGDQIDGGAGNDTLALAGNYGLTVTGAMVAGVERLKLAVGATYGIAWQAQFAGKLVVDASGFESGQPLTFDGSAITAGAFHFICGSTGDYDVTGGGGNDTFDFPLAYDLIAHGGGGDDSFNFTDNYTVFNLVVGGSGFDTVTFDGAYAPKLFLSQGNLAPELGDIGLWEIEKVVLRGGQSYAVEVSSDITNDNGPLILKASELGAGETLSLDLTYSATTGHYVTAGAGADTITCGGGADRIAGGKGADLITAGASFTELAYKAGDSNGIARDVVTGIDWAMDQFDVPVDVTDAAFANGSISEATFDADIKAMIDAFFPDYEAVVVVVLSGDLAGRDFLIVDANGSVAYEAGTDLAIELVDQYNVISFSENSFI